MSVVIFLIFPGASELDRGFTAEKIIHEEFVEEFLAVITIKAKDRKRQRALNIFDLIRNVTESFAISGALF